MERPSGRTPLTSIQEPMEKLSFFLVFFFFIYSCFSIFLCGGIESPHFTVVHSEPDFEIRMYRDLSWMSASVQTDSFENATKRGFHRLYQYIHGVNENSSQLEMTSPVLTSVAATAAEYNVRLFLSPEIEGGAPRPLPALNLQLDKWESRCMVVRKFSGFAEDGNTVEEAEHLLVSLKRSNSTNNTIILEDKHPYAIAQYNSSSHLQGRLNEVWMKVLGYTGGGCQLTDLV